MRCADINKQTFYYALNLGKKEVLDDHGLRTGEYEIQYSEPVKMRANISASRGWADAEMFGVSTNYSKTLVTDKMDCPIKEDTVLWIDAEPTSPYNYIVVQVGKSLNHIVYAIDEVKVSG